MVEVALLLPLLILLLLGALDLGMWVFQTTQAASAARSGARMGILNYRTADVVGTTDEAAVHLAVARDTDNQAGVAVDIDCVGDADTTTKPCSTASVTSPDRIMVKVSWPRPPLTFVTKPLGLTQTITGTAVMVINGRPPGVQP